STSTSPQIPMAILLVTMRSERLTQKVEALLSSLLDAGLLKLLYTIYEPRKRGVINAVVGCKNNRTDHVGLLWSGKSKLDLRLRDRCGRRYQRFLFLLHCSELRWRGSEPCVRSVQRY